MLQDLIGANLDSAELCSLAGERLRSPILTDMLRDLAQERRLQAGELQALLALNDTQLRRLGTRRGRLRLLWVQLRTWLNLGDPSVVFLEVERGERRLKTAYQLALDRTKSSPVFAVLMDHYTAVNKRHARIREFRDAR